MSKVLYFFTICFMISTVLGKSYVIDDSEHDTPGDSGPLSVNCMRCIWDALGSIEGEECSADRCGPYDLTLDYWAEAHDETNVTEYRHCTKHVWCAYRTVQRYMSRYLPSCVRVSETRPVCETALALHLHGRDHCSRKLTRLQSIKMQDCRDNYIWSWLKGERPSTD